MNRPLRIAARKSDLSRLQAVTVAGLIQSHWRGIGKQAPEIEFHFSESLGDKNLSDPLWKMPEKGVFTSDLSRGLAEGEFDLVVHSWKDLPLESDGSVLGCPQREDSRDVILFRKEAITSWQKEGYLRVLSSSPRRERNLSAFLKEYLPQAPAQVEFVSVRGNIPTRIRKLIEAESGAHALVIAKAALDRLLHPRAGLEFLPLAKELHALLQKNESITAPLSINPPAPAQGALAIEARLEDARVREWVGPILDPEATQDVRRERATLARFGGGCHQKIGVSCTRHPFGRIEILRGITETGEVLDERKLISASEGQSPEWGRPWSSTLAGVTLFDRESLTPRVELHGLAGWYVSHPDALPAGTPPGPPIWCSGLMTWRALTRRGYWVRGCDDSLGEGRHPGFTKLGHADSPELGDGVATYRLIARQFADPVRELGIEGKTHFFWRSISQFERVSGLCPKILEAQHACGPGATARYLGGRVKNLRIFLEEKEWRTHHGILDELKSPV